MRETCTSGCVYEGNGREVNPLAASALEDVQNQPDDRGVAIDEVGIATCATRSASPAATATRSRTVATVAMNVDLAADVKGTHMSRFVEVLERATDVVDRAACAACR